MTLLNRLTSNLHFRSAATSAGVGESRTADLTLRAGAGDTVHLLASNDTIVDRYGTIITVEALMRDWWPGYQQHRTLSLQHNLPNLRGIEGRPNVGLAQRVDCAPQLKVVGRVLDQQTRVLIAQQKFRSASLEFVPLEVETRIDKLGKRVEVYHWSDGTGDGYGTVLGNSLETPSADVLQRRCYESGY